MPGPSPLNPLPLFGRGFSSKSPSVTTQKLINGYRDRVLDEDKSPLPIYGAPGLTLVYAIGTGVPARGGIVLDLPKSGGQYTFVVMGNKFWAINPVGSVIDGGTIFTTTGPVFFAWNGVQLMFVDGVNGWVFTPFSAALAQIVDPDFPQPGTGGPSWCTWLGSYFFVGVAGKGKSQLSAPNDCTTWNGLDFFNAETIPDNLTRGEADGGGGELVLFGDRSLEFWGMSQDANVVRRIGSAALEIGIVAAATVAKFKDGFAFLAQNKAGEVQAGSLNGHTFVSFAENDPDTNYEINNRSRTNLAAATAFSYFQDGHWFYQLNFPDASYLYDGMTDSWSGRTSSSTFGARHYANIRLALAQQPLVCDYRNGNIYLLDKTAYADNGEPSIFRLQTKHIFNGGNPVTINELAVEIEAGDGLTTGQGSNPQIMAQWSKDGGRTWGNEVWRTLGPIGRYRIRTTWRDIGRAKDWAFRFSISDPIPRKIVLATVDLEP